MAIEASIEVRDGAHIHRVVEAGRPWSRGELLERLERDAEARRWLSAVLAARPEAAFFFELPPLTGGTLDAPAELAIVDAPALARTSADPSSFERELAGATDVAAFGNLSGDAFLIVPAERGPRAAYAHLAAFVRSAPPTQVDALWARVAKEARMRVGPAPLWLSTAGMGVPWLHVRLDARPKYYRHAPYRVAR